MSYINTSGTKPLRDVSLQWLALEACRNGAETELVFMENNTRMSLKTWWEKVCSVLKFRGGG